MPKLTSASVEKLRPGKERREIPDSGCPSLRLVIQTSGHKSWAMRFRRPSGRSAKLTLGPVDLSSAEQDGDPVIGMPLTLVAARRLAVDILRQRAMGRDVVADIAAAKHRRLTEDAKSAANTFSVAARDFIIEYAVKKTRSSKTTARMIGFDRRKKGLSEPLARLMRSHLSTMFGWLVEHRRVASNPCASVHKPDGGKARDRVLSDAEIVKFWQAAETEKLAPMLKLLLLTGCRPREVLGMTRSEISDDGVWTIPSERSKNHLPHVVHLPPRWLSS